MLELFFEAKWLDRPEEQASGCQEQKILLSRMSVLHLKNLRKYRERGNGLYIYCVEGELVLNTGVTRANFRQLGNIRGRIEVLNKLLIIYIYKIFKNIFFYSGVFSIEMCFCNSFYN